AAELVTKADEEFGRRRFTEARLLFEQAHQADRGALDRVAPSGGKERWAYCILHDVTEQLNRPAAMGLALGELRQQVQGALALAPNAKVAETGNWLLREIGNRHKTQVTAANPETPTAPLQHLGRNSQGWQVVETKYFLVFHNQSRELAEKVALIAEKTRLEMQRKWFGN